MQKRIVTLSEWSLTTMVSDTEDIETHACKREDLFADDHVTSATAFNSIGTGDAS